MSDQTKKLLEDALQSLDESERALLAASLIDSLDPTTESQVDEAWSQEVLKRLNDLNTGAVNSVPWTEARKQILEEI